MKDNLRALVRLYATLLVEQQNDPQQYGEVDAFKELASLNALYSAGKRIPRNDKLYPCDDTRAETERQEVKILAEEAKQVRCPYCQKVIQYAGRNIHCTESGGKLKCEYCGYVTRAAA